MSHNKPTIVVLSNRNYGPNKVSADKAIRDLVPLGLKQAKAHVDAVLQGYTERILVQDKTSAALLVEKLVYAGFEAKVDDGNT